MKVFRNVLVVTFLHFISIIESNITTKAGNYAAPRGSAVKMSCIPPDVLIDESQVLGSKSFVWTDELGKEIVNPRMQTLETGELQIYRARDEDSGVYHCKFRPQEALKHDGALSKIYSHKLIVYELSGHKFETLVAFDVTEYDSEAAITSLRGLLKEKICISQLCLPGTVKSKKCELTDNEAQMCEMSMVYEAAEPATTAQCDERCVREIMVAKLKKAQKQLESALLALSENKQAKLKPDMQTIDTKHIITCKAGYHLIEANYEHCFPCPPGTFSELDKLRCDLCPIGFYQEKYGQSACEQCTDDRTTETAGSKSRDECRPITDTGILKDIKAGIASIFKG